ncbi:MAG: ATP-binding protein [Deltaproteobacteria bacterium]|nr:ATP-binding protein [Deltaproteobacteria bacterium]
MYDRKLESFAKKIHKQYPILTIIGPRQSGKSTFARKVFPKYHYVSLETTADKELAQTDPKGFFAKYPAPLIIDEVQRVPQLLSDLQTLVDQPGFNSHYILTGSHQLLLMEKVSQSLAGRTTILTLLPLSLFELKQKKVQKNIDVRIFTGGYPRIYDQSLDPGQWVSQYIRTYVERDVRAIAQLKDLDIFQRFLALCAGRVGQILNFDSLANDCGITGPTAKAWVSILEASFLVFRLNPHHKNFGKRVIKSSKLYFYDTAVLCSLLKIKEPDHLNVHPLRGFIFENFVILEKLKTLLNKGEEPQFYFWRDAKGREIDLVEDRGLYLFPTEIKVGQSFQRSYLDHLKYFNSLQKIENQEELGELVLGGDENYKTEGYSVHSWWDD